MSTAGNYGPTPAGFEQQRLIVNERIGLGAVFVQEEGVGYIFVRISPRDGTRHDHPGSDFGGLRRFHNVSYPREQGSVRRRGYALGSVRRRFLALVLAAQCGGMNIDLAAKASVHRRGNAAGMIGVAVTDDQGFGGPNIDSEQACVAQQRMPLAGIGEDAAVVRFNPQRKPPLARGLKSAGRVFNNCGDIQLLNHVAKCYNSALRHNNWLAIRQPFKTRGNDSRNPNFRSTNIAGHQFVSPDWNRFSPTNAVNRYQ